MKGKSEVLEYQTISKANLVTLDVHQLRLKPRCKAKITRLSVISSGFQVAIQATAFFTLRR